MTTSNSASFILREMVSKMIKTTNGESFLTIKSDEIILSGSLPKNYKVEGYKRTSWGVWEDSYGLWAFVNGKFSFIVSGYEEDDSKNDMVDCHFYDRKLLEEKAPDALYFLEQKISSRYSDETQTTDYEYRLYKK